MPTRNDALKDRLSRSREINITVTGRKSGRSISIPVWFVLEAGGAEAEVRAVPVKDATQVKSMVEKFREKYGAKDVKKYYSKFDVAVLAHVR